MNDENTVMMSSTSETPKSNTLQPDKQKENNGWQKVAIGGVAGIMLGAGTATAYAKHQENQAESVSQQADKPTETHQSADNETVSQDVKATEASDDMSFKEAFDEARAEVGPGGVFHWHGGLYSTYTEAEWNAMSDADKQEFAERAQAEVREGEDNPDVYAQNASHPSDDNSADTDVVVADNQNQYVQAEVAVVDNSTVEGSDDVHVVGYGQTEGGNDVAFLDVDGNGSADVALIDADGSGSVTPNDILMNPEGNYATVAELMEQEGVSGGGENDPSLLQASNEELSPDMPDYMNDADVDMMA